MKEEISEEAKNSIVVILADLMNIKNPLNGHLLEAQKRIISRIEADIFGNGTIHTFKSIEETYKKNK